MNGQAEQSAPSHHRLARSLWLWWVLANAAGAAALTALSPVLELGVVFFFALIFGFFQTLVLKRHFGGVALPLLRMVVTGAVLAWLSADGRPASARTWQRLPV